MIKTTAMLLDELSNYSNPAAKIGRMVKAGQITPVIRGVYETDRKVPGYCLARVIYGPSYLSYEFALSWHGLIPEKVYTYTSATCGKRRVKRYETAFGAYLFRDIPEKAFPFGIDIKEERGYPFLLATPEKALCDQLYILSPCGNRQELRAMLFEDLRLDEESFESLDHDDLIGLASKYRTANHRLLISLVKEMKRHDPHL
ncbi:MAG: hypothetical protein IKR78_06205 [Dehalococcoidales bacterium]|nr:hypothetical protein [Dehalococcoidales bacterium]